MANPRKTEVRNRFRHPLAEATWTCLCDTQAESAQGLKRARVRRGPCTPTRRKRVRNRALLEQREGGLLALPSLMLQRCSLLGLVEGLGVVEGRGGALVEEVA